MPVTQAEKGAHFRALHERPGAFVIPNPWDAGTARILTALGFEALTTTSAGLAFTLGRRDGAATRDETLANAKAIADATDLPVAADLDDTIRRLQAFEAAGADALYAPALTRAEDIRTVCASVSRPVNVVMGLKGASLSVAELAALGVRRISVGSALSRAALGAFVRAAREIAERGTFTFAADALTSAEANGFMIAHGR